jgi:hypothetical protein
MTTMATLNKFASEIKKRLIKVGGFENSTFIPPLNMNCNQSCGKKHVIRLKKYDRNICVIVTIGFSKSASVADACDIVLSLGDSIPSNLPNGAEVPVWICSGDKE